MNPFKSKYFFWVDIGAFRTDAEKWKSTGAWEKWPDVQAVKESFLGPKKDHLLVGLVHPFDLSRGDFFGGVLVEGGFFGGGKNSSTP